MSSDIRLAKELTQILGEDNYESAWDRATCMFYTMYLLRFVSLDWYNDIDENYFINITL